MSAAWHDDGELETASDGIPAQLRDPIGILKRGWRWGVISFVILVIPAVIGANLIPLQFEASTGLTLTGKVIPDEFVSNIIVSTNKEQFNTIENIVLSRSHLAKVAAETRRASNDEEANLSVAALVDQLRRSIEIETNGIRDARGRDRSMSVRVNVTGQDAEYVAEIANRISSDLVNAYLEYREEQSKVPLSFMQREFDRADEALRAHQRRLAEFRSQYRGSLPEDQPATLAKIERLEALRNSIILQINDSRMQLANPVLIPKTAELSARDQLEARLEELLMVYTDEHPRVTSVRRQLNDLIDESGGERDQRGAVTSRSRLENEIASRQARLVDIDREIVQLEALVSVTSSITEDYRALQREESVLQESSGSYLRKLKNAELSRSMETSQQGAQLVRLDSARPPSGPKIPRVVFTGGAVFMVLMASLVLAAAHEVLNPVVIDSSHLESLTSLPTLGSFPPIP